MSRRRLAVVGSFGLAVAVGGVGVANGWPARLAAAAAPAANGYGAAASPSAVPAAVATTPIEQRTMKVTADLDGTLQYSRSMSVLAGSAGLVTWLPGVGSVIKRNGRLYELNGSVRPRLLFGPRPMWRTVKSGIDDGADILQLEQNLKALGYAPKGMKVDRHWDSRTTTAVKRWQRAAQLTVDGSVDGRDAVFLPRAVRVASRAVNVGQNTGPGQPVLQGTSTAKEVSVDLGTDRRDLVTVGQAVTISLPDDSEVSGHVTSIGRVATAHQDVTGAPGTPTIPVTIGLDDPSKVGELDQAPVTVHLVTDTHTNVLAVRVDALVALLEGGYAVEVVGADGSRRYVSVDLGLFQDGRVEISGNGLEAGERVVVAS